MCCSQPSCIETCEAPSVNRRSLTLGRGAEVAPAAPSACCIHGNAATSLLAGPMEGLQALGSVASGVAGGSQLETRNEVLHDRAILCSFLYSNATKRAPLRPLPHAASARLG